MASETTNALKKGASDKYAGVSEEYKDVTPETFGPMSESKTTKYYPSISLKLEDIPEAKDWEIGKQYTVGIVVEMTRMSKSENENSVGFDILAVKAGEETSGYPDDDAGNDDEDDE